MSAKEKQIAAETRDIIERGYYRYDDAQVTLPLDKSFYEIISVLDEPMLSHLADNKKEVLAGKIQGNCVLKVTDSTAFEALRQEHMKEALVLNFADPYTPGGNFLEGLDGQEQSLCRCSTLSAALSNSDGETIYKKYQAFGAENYDGMLLAPFVDIIRDGNEKLLKYPWRCAVLSMPAINLAENNPGAAMVRDIMLRKIRLICLAAVGMGYHELVLGAWGCGVFRQQASEVASYFREVLLDEGWDKYFDKIVFAIKDASWDKKLYGTFAQILAQKKPVSLIGCLTESTHLAYFRRYKKRVDEIDNFEQGHDKGHTLRVLLMMTFIIDRQMLSAEALEIVYKAACFHDAGRVNGMADPTHGLLGAVWYREHCGEDEAVEFLIKYHSLDDEMAAAALLKSNFACKEEMWFLYQILKDADALDRVRFKYYGNGALDEKFLRLECSKEMVGVAYKLLASDLEI